MVRRYEIFLVPKKMIDGDTPYDICQLLSVNCLNYAINSYC
jgi:hypothetical protein